MNNNIITLKEICEKSYNVLKARGYSPVYDDDEHIGFECVVGGGLLTFYPIEDDVFGYAAEFKLERALTSEQRAHLERIYMEMEAEDVAFENLHIQDDCIVMSSAFTCDFYPEDMMELSIKVLESENGITAEIKSIITTIEEEV